MDNKPWNKMQWQAANARLVNKPFENIFEPTVLELYVDGGVIAVNPSLIGGTFAYRLVLDNGRFVGVGKVVTVDQMGGPVTNNQTEMLALLEGLKHLPDDWVGMIYSDSMVTLGRAFSGFRWKNIPAWMHKLYQEQRRRLIHWDEIKYVLLDGHPTKAQLKAGIGKRGHPVSEHNVWCDQACKKAGDAFMDAIGKNIPSQTDLSNIMIGIDLAKPGSERTVRVRTDLGMGGADTIELTLVPAERG